MCHDCDEYQFQCCKHKVVMYDYDGLSNRVIAERRSPFIELEYAEPQYTGDHFVATYAHGPLGPIMRTEEFGAPDFNPPGPEFSDGPDRHDYFLREGMGGHAGVWSRDPDAPDPNAPASASLMTQVHDAFGVGMNESIPMPPGGSGGGFGGTTEEEPYATSAGPLRWRGVEGSRSGFDLGGLVEMQARSYDPSIGRFLQADALPIASTTTQGMNRYIYCENDPVNRSDPTGMLWDTFFGLLYVAAGMSLMVAATIALASATSGLGFTGIGATLGTLVGFSGLALAAAAAFLATMFAGLALIMLGLAMLFPDQRCELTKAASLADAASDILSAGGVFSPKSLNRIVSAIQLALQGCGQMWTIISG